jgi:hypothetical protein
MPPLSALILVLALYSCAAQSCEDPYAAVPYTTVSDAAFCSQSNCCINDYCAASDSSCTSYNENAAGTVASGFLFLIVLSIICCIMACVAGCCRTRTTATYRAPGVQYVAMGNQPQYVVQQPTPYVQQQAYVPQQQYVAPQNMMVTVPPTAKPGSFIAVQTPGGIRKVQVPLNAFPGMQFAVQC